MIGSALECMATREAMPTAPASARFVPCIASIVLSLLLGAPWTTVAHGGPLVRYDDSGLTIHADRVPLDELLAAITRVTGIEIDGEPLDRRDVSKQMESVPLVQALRRVVGRQNFILYYGSDGDPERLQLLGTPLAPPTPARTRRLNALELLAKYPAVPVPSHLAQALGATSVRLHRVLGALRHADPVVRNEAAQTFVRTVESSPSLLDAVRRLDVTALMGLVSGQSGAHATEVALALYRSAHDPRLKGMLSVVLGTLRRTVA
jgi:hypothetical protein